VKRSRRLEAENARLKKLLVDRGLEVDVMKEIPLKNGEHVSPTRADPFHDGARPDAAEGLLAPLVSHSTVGYASTQLNKDAPVLVAMGVPSAQYPRFGYRRVHVSRPPRL